MRAVNPTPISAEWLRAQARDHVWAFNRVSRAFHPEEPFDTWGALAVLECFLGQHPMQRATSTQAATCQAGRFVAYERLGLSAGSAEIFRLVGPWVRATWVGNARSKPPLAYAEAGEWDAALLRNEAVAIFAGPIAGELLAGRDALNSIGELHAASALAIRAAELDGRVPSEMLRELVIGASALVERDDTIIGIVADELRCRKHISDDRPQMIPTVLQHLGREPVNTALPSPRDHALCYKIMGAFEHLVFLIQGVAIRGQLGELVR
jgi:hypothetical protein